MGLPLGFAILFFFFYPLKELVTREKKNLDSVRLAYYNLLLGGVTLSLFTMRIFWFILALVFSILYINENQKK